MKEIRFVKQYNAQHNPDTNFYVSFGRAVSDGKPYNLYTLPKYVKKFMTTHTCQPFDTKDTLTCMKDSADGAGAYSYIYR